MSLKLSRPDLLTGAIYSLLLIIAFLLFQRHANTQHLGCIEEGHSVGHEDLLSVRHNGYACGLSRMDIDPLTDLQVYLSLNSVLDNTDTICNRKIRVGGVGYGGWEVCDDADVRPGLPCTALFLQSGNNFTAAQDLVQLYRCSVKVFDLTLPDAVKNHSAQITVYNPAMAGKAGTITWNEDMIEEVMTIAHVGNTDIMILDIPGSEWSVLNAMAATGDLDFIPQILAKFQVNDEGTVEKQRFKLKVLKQLEERGFKKFYSWKWDKSETTVKGFPTPRPQYFEANYILRHE